MARTKKTAKAQATPKAEDNSILGMLENKIDNLAGTKSEPEKKSKGGRTKKAEVGVSKETEVLSKKTIGAGNAKATAEEKPTTKAKKTTKKSETDEKKPSAKRVSKKASETGTAEIPSMRSVVRNPEYTQLAIRMRDGVTGAEIVTYPDIATCLEKLSSNYNIRTTRSAIFENLFNLSNCVGGFKFEFVDDVKSPYENERYHFVNTGTGDIVATGTLSELAKLARVTPKFIIDTCRYTEQHPDNPKLIITYNALVIRATNDMEHDIERALNAWAYMVEREQRMFPTISNSKGKIIACFADVFEACGAISRVTNNDIVINNIRSACYNEKAYIGFKWSYKPASAYLKYRYLNTSENKKAITDTEKYAVIPDDVPKSFSTSEEVRDCAIDNIERFKNGTYGIAIDD